MSQNDTTDKGKGEQELREELVVETFLAHALKPNVTQLMAHDSTCRMAPSNPLSLLQETNNSLQGSTSHPTAELHPRVPRQAQKLPLHFQSTRGWIPIGTTRSQFLLQKGEAWLTLMHIVFT